MRYQQTAKVDNASSTLFNSRVAASSLKSAFESLAEDRENIKHTAESRPLLAASCVNAKSCICSEKEQRIRVFESYSNAAQSIHMFRRSPNSQPRVKQCMIFFAILDGLLLNYWISSTFCFERWNLAPIFK